MPSAAYVPPVLLTVASARSGNHLTTIVKEMGEPPERVDNA
jgi:hypothetical protein